MANKTNYQEKFNKENKKSKNAICLKCDKKFKDRFGRSSGVCENCKSCKEYQDLGLMPDHAILY